MWPVLLTHSEMLHNLNLFSKYILALILRFGAVRSMRCTSQLQTPCLHNAEGPYPLLINLIQLYWIRMTNSIVKYIQPHMTAPFFDLNLFVSNRKPTKLITILLLKLLVLEIQNWCSCIYALLSLYTWLIYLSHALVKINRCDLNEWSWSMMHIKSLGHPHSVLCCLCIVPRLFLLTLEKKNNTLFLIKLIITSNSYSSINYNG